MPTILITGGSGFIGRHFCREAKNLGWSIIVLSRNVEAAKKVLPNSIDVLATLCLLYPSDAADYTLRLYPCGRRSSNKSKKTS